LIKKNMSYKELKSYQTAKIIFDLNEEFCKKYVSRFSRTLDQMIQAARSGKQNIVEGSEVSKTSKKSEIKLLGVARASLEELKEDYEDYLRNKNLRLWAKDSNQAKEIRQLAYRTNRSHKTYKSYIKDQETGANCLICLINQANYLLDKQIRVLKEKHMKEGGLTEELYRKRKKYRGY